MKWRRVHILSDQERDCMNFYEYLGFGFRTPEDLSSDIRVGKGVTYSPARVLEIAQYCARINGDVDIWYNAEVDKKTLIRGITPQLLAREIDAAMVALVKALQDVYAMKASQAS
jgi:hypothetical protein